MPVVTETITVTVRSAVIRLADSIAAETGRRERSPFSIALIQTTRYWPARLRGNVLYVKDIYGREYSCGECPAVRQYQADWLAGKRVAPAEFVLTVRGRV